MVFSKRSLTFVEKMSNPAFMFVCFEGERRELRSLYGIMKRLQERKTPLVKNGFHEPRRWLGNLITRLGGDISNVYCRGTWSDLRLSENCLSFFTETAWQPPVTLLQLIQECYPSLKFYFEAEGDDWDSFLTNDAEGKYFPSRYVVDCEPDMEYFNTIEEACNHLSAYIGKSIAATWQAINEAADKWNDEHPDTDWPISVKQIEIVSNDEL